MSEMQTYLGNLDNDILNNGVFSFLAIRDLWMLTGVDKQFRSKIFAYCNHLVVLNLSPAKWRLRDHHLTAIVPHFPNITSLSLEDCTKVTGKSLALFAHCKKLVRLDLQGCESLDNKSISKVVNALPCLEVLDLRGISFDYGGVDDAFLKGIEWGKIKEFYVWNSQITDVGLSLFSTKCTNLQVLDLWNSREISSEGIDAVAENCKTLRELNLSNVPNISTATLDVISQKCSSLRSLDISLSGRDHNLDEGIPFLTEGCCDFIALKLRNLGWVPSITLQMLAAKHTNLQVLDLGGANHLDDDTLKCFAEHCPLTELYIWYTSVTDRGVFFLAQNCPNIKNLELWNCEITDVGIENLANGLFAAGLKMLILRGCENITDLSLRYLSETCPNLENLSLRACRQITDKGIATLVEGCNQFDELMLSFCHNLGDASLQAISKKCHNLKKLFLPELSLVTDAGLEFLSSCSTLEEISLQQCTSITDEGLKSLSKLPKLRRIDLEHLSFLTDEGIGHIASKCKDLEEIFLSHCSNLTGQSVRMLVDKCQGITEITLLETQVTIEEVDEITEDRDDLIIEL